ncbi:MAG: efflux RND transporter periplasmic adaptor subunit [Cytophagales bacterium]|nr:efflux RND transporter periplasmic adaptor subunit [Cytophagales bacterium]
MNKRNLLFISFLALLFSCNKKEDTKRAHVRPVKAIQAETAADQLSKGLPAVSAENREVELSFRVGGPLIKLTIEEGMAVKKGRLIAEIDPRDYRVALIGDEGRMNQAGAEEQRYKNLYKKGSVSKNEYDIKLANYLEAKAKYENAVNAVNDTKIYAPFDGFIGKKLVENFQDVAASQTIATLLDLSRIEIHTHIPENLAIYFPQFSAYRVVFDAYPEKQFTATLKEAGKTPDPAGYPLSLYLDFVNSPTAGYIIAPGLTCGVDIILANDAGTTSYIVPLSAVFEGEKPDSPAVWVMDKSSNFVTKRDVKVGSLISHSSIEIQGGIESGEWIVTAGVHKLTEGQKVKPIMDKL